MFLIGASCDAAFYKNRPVAVIGGGNSALEETKVLANICSQIYMINRDREFSGQKILIDYIISQKNIKIFHNSNITRLLGQDNLEKVTITDQHGNNKDVVVDGLFAFIGSIPANQIIDRKWNILDQDGYIVTDANFQTKIPQLYAIGDVASGNLQQYTTAMGSATIAITEIIKSF